MGRRVFTNSGRLYISAKTINQGVNQVKLIYSDGNQVPYYEGSVTTNNTKSNTKQICRTEYADDKGKYKLYGNDTITNVKNRNICFIRKVS